MARGGSWSLKMQPMFDERQYFSRKLVLAEKYRMNGARFQGARGKAESLVNTVFSFFFFFHVFSDAGNLAKRQRRNGQKTEERKDRETRWVVRPSECCLTPRHSRGKSDSLSPLGYLWIGLPLKRVEASGVGGRVRGVAGYSKIWRHATRQRDSPRTPLSRQTSTRTPFRGGARVGASSPRSARRSQTSVEKRAGDLWNAFENDGIPLMGCLNVSIPTSNLNFHIQCPNVFVFLPAFEGGRETIPWLDRLIFSTNIRVILRSPL